MTYYAYGSDEYYLESNYWAKEREFFLKNQCILMNVNEANRFDLSIFFKKNNDDVKPLLNQDFTYFIIPYELDDIVDNDSTAYDIIIQLVSNNIKDSIYIASTDNDKCCFIKCENITEDILYNLYSNHLNTPFIIFGEDRNFFSLIDFDLPIQIVGYKNFILDSNNFIINKIGQVGWLDLFERYNHYTNLRYIFERYYKSLN